MDQESATPSREPEPFHVPPLHPLYPLASLLVRAVCYLLAPRLSISGRAHLPASGPFLITPNHLADADPPIMTSTLRRPAFFMAKQELFKIPVLGRFVRFARSFPVDREGFNRSTLHYAENLLRHGAMVVVFPEGHVSPCGKLQPVLPGAAMLALRSGVPVVPVGISGSPRVIPYSKILPRPTWRKIHVHFGAPISFADLADLPRKEAREAATQRLQEALARVVRTSDTVTGESSV